MINSLIFQSQKGLLAHFQKCSPSRFELTTTQQASTMSSTPKEIFKLPIAKQVVAEVVPKKNPARSSRFNRA